MRVRKICVITGTRAEYGVIAPLLREIRRSKGLRLQLVVTGMHLLPEFGSTIRLIKKDGFQISASFKMYDKKDADLEIPNSLCRATAGCARAFKHLQPDIVLLEGDRLEMLAAALASLAFRIPLVHVSGGDVSGGLDDSIRHTLTRLSHIHLANTLASCQRVKRMGEEPWRVSNVGTLAVTKAILREAASIGALKRIVPVDCTKPYFLVVQHPVIEDAGLSALHMRQTLVAALSFDVPVVVMYPNCDTGSRESIEEIDRFRKNPRMLVYRNLARSVYLGLLKHASVIIGNSSSGIVEAPFFGTPVVNVGSRQFGRERAGNTVDVSYSTRMIRTAIAGFRRNGFKRIFKNNPYRDMDTQKRIVRILRTIALDEKLLNKKLML